ncbi:MAG TPA: DUF1329 domain-containing protein [Pseudomonadales bacterium]|nr:DUF1329 domain-containing protein [Pseudomonadales bacterium]
MISSERQQQRRGATLGVVVVAIALWLPTVAADESALTPIGAERAGNADGSIPPWKGGITQPPPNYDPLKHCVDPYPGDEVLFTIDASNAQAYADKLSEGQRALLAEYPDTWRMRVYPTRRSASYPDFVYDAVLRNEATAKLLDGKGGVSDARVGSPFRLPKNGLEAIWNHNLRWRGLRVERSEGSAAVTPKGRYTLVLSIQQFAFPYDVPGDKVDWKFSNVLFAAKSKTLAPAPLTGRGSLILQPIDETRDPRKVWLYAPALRQLVLQANYGYDLPAPNTDALRTVDQYELFTGPTDRFEWTLLGKREMYIPYNAYRVHGDDVAVERIVGRNHLDPDLLRYELHRVWVVEAVLKPGAKHIYRRRRFYLDEDSWQVAVSDSWDLTGSLSRTAEAHAVNYYQVPVLWSTLFAYYDLHQHRYLVEGLDNGRGPYRFTGTADPREFTPNALNYYLR